VEAGSAASIHYDPLLAKVIAHGPDRAVAVRRLALALRSARIHAGITNRSLLVRILEHPEYLAGDVDTDFLERHEPVQLSAPLLDVAAERRAAIAAALAGQEQRRAEAKALSSIPSGWRNSPSQPQVAHYTGENGDHEVLYRFTDTGLEVEGERMVRLGQCTSDLVDLEIESLRAEYSVHSVGEVVYVDGPEGPAHLIEVPRFRSADAEEPAGSLHAPMPGRVIKVAVAEGDEVAEGAVLMVIEAMKMEHALRAPYSGRVSSLKAAEGDQVVAAAVLVVVEQE
jgi:propionyl-CoA carboxylase alpha chain